MKPLCTLCIGLLCLLLIAPTSWAQDLSIDDLILKDGTYHEKSSEEPFTGEVNSNAKAKLINGKKDGLWREYRDNVALNITYKNGKAEGLAQAYDSYGNLVSTAYYKNDKLEGPSKSYHLNGSLRKEGIYKNGEAAGLWMEYYDDGQLQAKGIYTNGKKEGQWRAYHPNGKIHTRINYENGAVIDGPWASYFDNGKYQAKGTYVNNEWQGSWRIYYKTGRLKEKAEYKAGKRHGATQYFHENGARAGKVIYADGEIVE